MGRIIAAMNCFCSLGFKLFLLYKNFSYDMKIKGRKTEVKKNMDRKSGCETAFEITKFKGWCKQKRSIILNRNSSIILNLFYVSVM